MEKLHPQAFCFHRMFCCCEGPRIHATISIVSFNVWFFKDSIQKSICGYISTLESLYLTFLFCSHFREGHWYSVCLLLRSGEIEYNCWKISTGMTNQLETKSHISCCVTATSYTACLCSCANHKARFNAKRWITCVSRECARLCMCLHQPPYTSTQCACKSHLVCKSHPDFQGEKLIQNCVTYTRVKTVFT